MAKAKAPKGGGSQLAKERMRQELVAAQIIPMADYQYVAHPILDGFPHLEPEYVSGIADAMVEAAFPNHEAPGVDGIITVEAMGIPLAFLVAKALKVPLHIARKKEYKVPGEVVVRRKTPYSESHVSFNGLEEGKTYWFLDSLLASGGTLRAAVLALNMAGARMGGAVFLVSKLGEEQARKLTDLTKAPIVAVFHVEVVSAATATGGEARGYRVRVSDGFTIRT